MPIDYQPVPPLLVTRLEPGPDGRHRVATDPPDLDQEDELVQQRIRAGFGLPNVRVDIREAAQRHSRELRQGPNLIQLIEDEMAEQRRVDNERLMQPYVRRTEVRPIPLEANPTVRLSDIRTRRFDLIDRTIARLPEAVQRILSAILGRPRPEPEKPVPGPVKSRYERLKDDLPEL